VGSLLFVYTQPAFQKYAAATDAWETGLCRVPPALVCLPRREARVLSALCCSFLCASAVGSELASRRAARCCVLPVACCQLVGCVQ
jgi:hypothetical protein